MAEVGCSCFTGFDGNFQWILEEGGWGLKNPAGEVEGPMIPGIPEVVGVRGYF